MALVYLRSVKNTNMLLHEGFLHTREKVFNEKTYWKCCEHKKPKSCKGRVHVIDEKVVKFIPHNNHKPHAVKIEVNKVISSLKQRASQTTLTPRVLVKEMLSQLPSALAADMPSVYALKRIVQRIRLKDKVHKMSSRSEEMTQLLENCVQIEALNLSKKTTSYNINCDLSFPK